MIVVEGFDASGKSVLAKKLALRLQWNLYHTGGPTKDEIDVMHCLRRSYNRMYEQCVQDRVTHVSESVYSMLSAPEKAAPAIDRLRELCIAKVIYCRPPTEFLLEAVKNDHLAKEHDTPRHLDMVLSKSRELIAIYDTIMAVVNLYSPVHTYDRTIEGADTELIEQIYGRYK